ncbi:putative disulfide isomerase [Ilyonectria robusta]|uniref:putative disulfide isomerase n=1 Tax=Ilyonectria robusta TaxID=1079257 RepID=UPI001E8CD21D|nr:putative disulfide isomerase [Ilyonectria robusta]KAH8735916.1 putative disulfide isomerase [Ilyonectria robusta]
MRLSSFAVLTGAMALAGAQLMPDEEDFKKEATYFNDKKVPALLELTPANWEAEITKTKYLFVKHYSPYCPHCIDFAPTFQSIYEFYYTSQPVAADAVDTTFLKYYDFRFATINCVAYYDLCMDHAVQSYPTSIIYENGAVFESMRGVKNATFVSAAVEKALEKAMPGSRPATLDLPDVKDEHIAEKKKAAKAAYKKMEADRIEKEEAEKAAADAAAAEKAAAEKAATEKAAAEIKAPEQSLDDITEKPQTPDASDKVKEPAKSDGTEKSTKDQKADASKEVINSGEANGNAAEKTFGDDWKVPSTGEMLKKTKPKEPATIYNPEGVSVPLTPGSFEKLVTSTQDPWFIKFYAPWCSHCRAMAPAWEQMAKSVAGKLNVGEVNCDAESRLCKEVGARAYPTVRFYKGGESSEYKGLRGLGDFVQYAEKALEVAGGIIDVDAAALKEMEKEEEVIFVYFYDHATTTEDFKALEQLPLNLIGRAKIVKTNDPDLNTRFGITTWPRFLVSREGRPTYYTPITPDEMRDMDALVDWMKSVWLPLVPEMTATNARQIMEHKIVALAVLNRDDGDRLKNSISELKTAASDWMDRQVQEFQLERTKLRDSKQMRIEEAQERGDQRGLRNAKAIKIDMDSASRQEVAFAWVDGVFWARWLQKTYGIDVKDGERVIVNEEDRKRFWDSTSTGNHIMVTRTSIMETLDKVVYGPNPITTKYTISSFEKIFFDIKMSFVDRPFLSCAFVVAAIFGVYSWLRSRSRRSRSYLFPRDDSMGLKDGLLGQPNNAKAD